MRKSSSLALWLMLGGGTASSLFAQAPIQFNARGLVTLSDADMSASALVDGRRYPSTNVRDQLTCIAFPLSRNGQHIGQRPLSNSMLMTDKALAVSSNGKLGFVLEGRSGISDGTSDLQSTNDFPATNALFILDLTNPQNPEVKYRFPVGTSVTLTALSLAPNGASLIIGSGEAGKEFKLVEFDATGKPTRLLTTPSPLAGATITDVTFHPSGQFVAYTTSTGEVGLMRFAIDESTRRPSLTPYGRPVKVGTLVGAGKFTANGSYFVVTDSRKAPNANGAGPGEVSVVQFGTDNTPTDARIVSQLPTGENPEAVAISPDGSMVVVVSAGQSYQPFTNASAGRSELALYTLRNGRLAAAAKTTIDGIMPQTVEFDKTGDNLAVGIAEYLDYGLRNGGIEFYRVSKGDQPHLTRQPGRISVTRGLHAMKVVN